jgi:hypothetical protein
MKSFKNYLSEKKETVMQKSGDVVVYKTGSHTIRIEKGGKTVASGDFDYGADSFFVSIPNVRGQKSFSTIGDIIKHFKKGK